MAVTKIDPTQLAKDWATKMAAAGPRMKAGAEALTTAPGQAAAAASGRWVTAVSQAEPQFKRNVAAVSLQQWQSDFVDKGVARVGAGAQKAENKFAQILGKILQNENSIVPNLPARGDTEANIARSGEFQRRMAATKGTYR